jgi:hypothetical protein
VKGPSKSDVPDLSHLAARIRELEVELREFGLAEGDAGSSGSDCTNGCTYGCTHGCTGGCTGAGCGGFARVEVDAGRS